MEERKPYGVKKEMKNKDRFKFRAWDKSFHKYCENVIVSTINKEITVYGRLVGGRTELIPNSHVELEQCTGLKDKYEKLIYEGDIVNILPEEELAVISWDSDRACVVFETEDCCYSFDNFFSYELEVIGNIHENPELLEE